MQGRIVDPMIHCELEDIPVGVGVSRALASLKWFVGFKVCQLPFVCSTDEQWFTSLRGVVFCLLRSAEDRDPSLQLLTVNISHAVMNV